MISPFAPQSSYLRSRPVTGLHYVRLFIAVTACVLAVAYSLDAVADDMVTFATGGYASGLRSHEMKSQMEANGDGMISRDEWMAFQEQVFSRLDIAKKGNISARDFVYANGGGLETFATGGYARGLRTRELIREIDTNGDRKISHDEFMAYQMKVFDFMHAGPDHKGSHSNENLFDEIRANR